MTTTTTTSAPALGLGAPAAPAPANTPAPGRTPRLLPGRWVLGAPAMRDWPQCRYCGRAASVDCRPIACELCGTVQCHGNGGVRGMCACCVHGFLPGWSRPAEHRVCSRKGCDAPAVGVAARKPVCLGHATAAKIRVGGRSLTLAAYAAEAVAERDARRARWHYVGALAPRV